MDANPVGIHKGVGANIQCIRTPLNGFKRGRYILRSADFEFKNMRLTKKSMSREDRAAIQRFLSLRAPRKKRISSAATPKRT